MPAVKLYIVVVGFQPLCVKVFICTYIYTGDRNYGNIKVISPSGSSVVCVLALISWAVNVSALIGYVVTDLWGHGQRIGCLFCYFCYFFIQLKLAHCYWEPVIILRFLSFDRYTICQKASSDLNTLLHQHQSFAWPSIWGEVRAQIRSKEIQHRSFYRLFACVVVLESHVLDGNLEG